MELLIQNHIVFFYAFVAVISLLIGSFLNVVIARLPTIMFNQWRQECVDFLKLETSDKPDAAKQPFNLAYPRSQCPQCQNTIAFYDNIPVLSYLWLRGKCRHCQQSISFRYPFIEILTAVISVLVVSQFGATWQSVWSLVLVWGLICAAFIDIDHKLLPDAIVLPLLWLGLTVNLFGVFTTLPNALIGAISGYLILRLFAELYQFITKREGMGRGDMKLLAMFGAWLGYQMVPLILLLSSLAGAILGLLLMQINRGISARTELPYGPYIAIAGVIALFYGHDIINWYLLQINLS
jgi:leader peptidase (prepilin peptidase) / N-methyltransferase